MKLSRAELAELHRIARKYGSTMALADALDAIPVVTNAAERNARFPAPQTNQRVHNLATARIERWSGSWVSDFAAVGAIDVFNVQASPYAADPTGANDCTAAIQAAIDAATAAGGGTVYIPRGTYRLLSQLSTADNSKVSIVGDGAGSILDKRFNGDVLSLGKECHAIRFYIAGNGSLFTGRGIVVSTGANDVTSWRRFRDLMVMDTASYCLEFTAPLAGFFSSAIGCQFRVYNSTTYAIKMPTAAETNGNRDFIGCIAPSGGLCDLGGSQNSGFIGCESGGATLNDAFLFTANTIKARIFGCRLANNADCTVLGTENTIVGNITPSKFILGAGAASCTIADNGYSCTIDDNSGNNSNGTTATAGFVVFTPVWTCASGAAPSLGNGSLNGNYTRQGRKVTLWIEFQAGSTTTFGGGPWQFSLPFPGGSGREYVGIEKMFDAGGVGGVVGFCSITAAAPTVVSLGNASGGGAVTATVPFAWGNLDRLVLEITYSL